MATVSRVEPRRLLEGTGAPADTAWRFLQLSARLLLEYNERSALIKRQLGRLAACLGLPVSAAVGYRQITLVGPSGHVCRTEVTEFRINVAVSVATLNVIDALCAGHVDVEEALSRLESVERSSSRLGPWLVAPIFGVAASALAALLGADDVAVVTSGVAAGIGLIARRALAKRTALTFAPIFIAAAIGAALGGLAIRLGWTGTPTLCLVVPALMLVPGPHLINAIEDMLENEMQTGICRLCLAIVILLAAALGVVTGAWLFLGRIAESGSQADGSSMTLLLDVVLAGAASCGFGAFYNAPWRVAWVSIVSGMVGHGIRFLCLQSGAGLPVATLLACVPIGIIGGMASIRLRLPFASVAFAGAVPMMPGASIYQSIAGAMRLSSAGTTAAPTLAVATLAPFLQAGFVVTGMTLGLVAGARIATVALRNRSDGFVHQHT